MVSKERHEEIEHIKVLSSHLATDLGYLGNIALVVYVDAVAAQCIPGSFSSIVGQHEMNFLLMFIRFLQR